MLTASPIAAGALRCIAELYAIETTIQAQPRDRRLAHDPGRHLSYRHFPMHFCSQKRVASVTTMHNYSLLAHCRTISKLHAHDKPIST